MTFNKIKKSFLNIFEIKTPFSEVFLILVSFIVILIYFLPYIILGGSTPIAIHDNLDSVVSWVKVLLDNNELFSSPTKQIPQIFNGINRSSLYGTYDFSLIWFKLFGIYWGYVFNKFLISCFAFIGMYYLLKRHFLDKDCFIVIPFGVSLIFSLLPFWSFTMTVSGIPLALFAFLNIRNRNQKFYDWLIILLFPFYSSLILSGVFFILVMFFLFIYDTSKSKKINYSFLLGLALFCSMYLISHFPLFYTLIYKGDYISHRVEFDSLPKSIKNSLLDSKSIFLDGQYHAHSLHKYSLFTVPIALFLMIFYRKINKKYILILSFILLTSLFYGIINWYYLHPFIKKLMTLIPIQLQRFHFLHPMFWYVLFGIALSTISKYLKFGKQFVIVILLAQFLYVIKYHDVFANRHSPSFNNFYDEEKFKEIKEFINLPEKSYRVISLGFHPSIAQFNGFYTLDGYLPDYSLKYKHLFRKTIEKELNKDNDTKLYFDTWGSRCYAFSSEMGRSYFIEAIPHKIQKLDFDFELLKKMGCKFIFSRLEINTNNNSKIKLLKVFEKNKSYWQIYLYELI